MRLARARFSKIIVLKKTHFVINPALHTKTLLLFCFFFVVFFFFFLCVCVCVFFLDSDEPFHQDLHCLSFLLDFFTKIPIWINDSDRIQRWKSPLQKIRERGGLMNCERSERSFGNT